MCYEYSLRKKVLKDAWEHRRHEVSFWTKVTAWAREAKAALTDGKTGIPAKCPQRHDRKVTG